MIQEEWREIPCFTRYEASNTGLIRRHINKPGITSRGPGELLKLKTDSYGHTIISLMGDDGDSKTAQAAYFILIAFGGEQPLGSKPLYLDYNKTNLRLDNIQWGTDREHLIHRFYYYVKIEDITGCHIYTGSKNSSGYGVFSIKSKLIFAHRFIWEFINKEKIPRGYDICHKCDTRLCVNPDHLFLGTRRDNMQDAKKKGRHTYKVSDNQVVEIQELRAEGYLLAELAKKFGISLSQTSHICSGKRKAI